MDIADEALLTVSREAFTDEAACVQQLLAAAKPFRPLEAGIQTRATGYVESIRAGGRLSGMEAFLQAFSLSSHEGIMLMCLAESLLRIPDKRTADRLIEDKLSASDWDKHVGLGRSWLVRSASRALALAGMVASPASLNHSAGEFLGGLIHRLGEPVVRGALRQAMALLGGMFVLGETLKTAQANAKPLQRKGYRISYDMLGEGARSEAQAECYFDHYSDAISQIDTKKKQALFERDSISIKLSALHPRFELRHWDALEKTLLPRVKTLVMQAAAAGIAVTIDAEESTRLDVTLKLFAQLFNDKDLAGYEGFGIAVQAYHKRAVSQIAFLGNLSKQAQAKRRIPLRLVKGAYWDSEIKRAQQEGLENFPVFTRKYHTDLCYLACAAALLENPECFYPQFATHNAHTVAAIIELAGKKEFEFQRLQGMGEALYDTVMKDTGRACRIYAPVGPAQDLLSYLIRRILENGANTSFVNALADNAVPASILIADPITRAESTHGQSAAAIRHPGALFPDRENARGYDLGNAAHLKTLTEGVVHWLHVQTAKPEDATQYACNLAMERAYLAWDGWRHVSVETRAQTLERIAVLYEQHSHELIALCMHEAGKTLIDAVAELRESIDYCRYYAVQARGLANAALMPGPTGERNVLTLHPRGVAVAISPWNFPLAIFTGQIVAALVTGNCVVAKPAEQTPRIATLAVQLMQTAGIPRDVLQLLCGSGETVGQTLVMHKRTGCVVFTGSTAAAWAINRTLAAREAAIAPLIAETGGQNCMVIDSSALIEQTVDDMVASAFTSAGQRCSALRVAFVQEDIADTLLNVLTGAVRTLRVNDAQLLSTDIGPVIDEDAYTKIMQHIDYKRTAGRVIAEAALPPDAKAKRLVPACVIEIPHISVLPGEIFGPVLHIIRYKADALDDVIAQINSTGYALTCGIQSRIDRTITHLATRVQAGNIYVNRSMIGAAVGVQPFGGHGLSGTGPKAGGPHYLMRFVTEQTVSTNTSAVGGNLELLIS